MGFTLFLIPCPSHQQAIDPLINPPSLPCAWLSGNPQVHHFSVPMFALWLAFRDPQVHHFSVPTEHQQVINLLSLPALRKSPGSFHFSVPTEHQQVINPATLPCGWLSGNPQVHQFSVPTEHQQVINLPSLPCGWLSGNPQAHSISHSLLSTSKLSILHL